MKISKQGIDLIRRFEGCSTNVYKDAAGFNTIGIGHKIKKGEIFGTLTLQEAEDLLKKDIHLAEDAITTLVKKPLKQCQFDALCSFVFNLGSGEFTTSTLLKEINTGNYDGAAKEFKRWDYSKGKVLDGLTKRRAAEALLFSS